MKRQLTLAIVGVVAAALVVAGLGTFVLARLGARDETERELRNQAEELAASIEDANDAEGVRSVAGLRRVLDVEGLEVEVVTEDATSVDLPAGVDESDVDVDALRSGETVSGWHGSLAYAAAGAEIESQRQTRLAVVVVTRREEVSIRALRWFAVAAAATLVAGVLVAWRLGRRLTNPLRRAEHTTHQIAGGDLSARLPDPGPGDTDEMADLARSINTMAENLERSKGLERQFLLSVSHDLRTPLTSIRGYAEAIADGTARDPAAAAGVILAESRRLERLVSDLLALAKLEARRFSLDLQPVDLADIAAGTVDGFRLDAEDAGVAIDVDVPPQPVVVTGDPDRLAQVTANLLENAFKFAVTNVGVSVAAADGRASLAVTDDGPGIPDEDRPHVFERLYVSRRQPRRKEAGSGLGLAIVRELVGAMGGTVTAENAGAGRSGARLVVELPLADQR
jgi:two-component system OmpR family sensor kinase